jgi:diadenosine tetraphosphate (Ap4A) HIT family hydrolase
MENNVTFRTPELEAVYRAHIEAGGNDGACPLCGAPSITEFEHWRIIANKFPYDRIAEVHHMIVSKRHATDEEIAPEEWREYQSLKTGYINDTYGYIIEPTRQKKSLPGHSHLHLIVSKA